MRGIHGNSSCYLLNFSVNVKVFKKNAINLKQQKQAKKLTMQVFSPFFREEAKAQKSQSNWNRLPGYSNGRGGG